MKQKFYCVLGRNNHMAVSIDKARAYVYGNGVLWERALFGWLFDGRPLAQVHQALLAYKNDDGGWGHGLEHDLKCPDSNPLALEFLLSLNRDTGLPIGDLLNGTVAWVEANRAPDGSLCNPPTTRSYPIAPWWQENGGQTIPDAITGNLTRLGLCSPNLAESTRRWVQANVTLDSLRANEWLFMAYHGVDYFLNVPDFPDIDSYRRATLDNVIACAQAAPEKQAYVVFQFAPTPQSPVAQASPDGLITRRLDYLERAQREDGGWDDEHGLSQWQPYVTIISLLALQNYDRL
jgi:hypothetical protein